VTNRPAAADDLAATLRAYGVVPVIALERAVDAVPVARALVRGGLPCAEITFRTAAATDAIRAIRDAVPDVFLAAGSVRTTAQVDDAIAAGAQLIVAPGFSTAIVDHCLGRGVPVMPGVATPSELELAQDRGLTVLKFFPAEAMGGITWLKAIAGPYRSVGFVPTGGVDPDNLAAYLAVPNVIAVGGTWLVKADVVAAGQFDRIEALAAEAVTAVRRRPR
jgi:2-dehydro-3-deoxyphosphogluconate aldolase/(4S)-4-hydroxy-2-oxoglutarate aldolase